MIAFTSIIKKTQNNTPINVFYAYQQIKTERFSSSSSGDDYYIISEFFSST